MRKKLKSQQKIFGKVKLNYIDLQKIVRIFKKYNFKNVKIEVNSWEGQLRDFKNFNDKVHTLKIYSNNPFNAYIIFNNYQNSNIVYVEKKNKIADSFLKQLEKILFLKKRKRSDFFDNGGFILLIVLFYMIIMFFQILNYLIETEGFYFFGGLLLFYLPSFNENHIYFSKNFFIEKDFLKEKYRYKYLLLIIFLMVLYCLYKIF